MREWGQRVRSRRAALAIAALAMLPACAGEAPPSQAQPLVPDAALQAATRTLALAVEKARDAACPPGEAGAKGGDAVRTWLEGPALRTCRDAALASNKTLQLTLLLPSDQPADTQVPRVGGYLATSGQGGRCAERLPIEGAPAADPDQGAALSQGVLAAFGFVEQTRAALLPVVRALAGPCEKLAAETRAAAGAAGCSPYRVGGAPFSTELGARAQAVAHAAAAMALVEAAEGRADAALLRLVDLLDVAQTLGRGVVGGAPLEASSRMSTVALLALEHILSVDRLSAETLTALPPRIVGLLGREPPLESALLGVALARAQAAGPHELPGLVATALPSVNRMFEECVKNKLRAECVKAAARGLASLWQEGRAAAAALEAGFQGASLPGAEQLAAWVGPIAAALVVPELGHALAPGLLRAHFLGGVRLHLSALAASRRSGKALGLHELNTLPEFRDVNAWGPPLTQRLGSCVAIRSTVPIEVFAPAATQLFYHWRL